jgi:hypothetical protein
MLPSSGGVVVDVSLAAVSAGVAVESVRTVVESVGFAFVVVESVGVTSTSSGADDLLESSQQALKKRKQSRCHHG